MSGTYGYPKRSFQAFARNWCGYESQIFPAAKQDTIINKESLFAQTNRRISGCSARDYLQYPRNSADCDETRQRQILETYLIDYDAMSGDDFDQFLSAREDALVRLIEAATGRPVARGEVQSVNSIVESSTEEGQEE
jgi:hypothetical protein